MRTIGQCVIIPLVLSTWACGVIPATSDDDPAIDSFDVTERVTASRRRIEMRLLTR